MNNISQLSEEEYKKICSFIPYRNIIYYFQKNPKEFSKLQRGFRATSLQKKDAIKLLVSYREREFVSSFVERTISDWIKKIQTLVQDYQGNGELEVTSYIHALYQSFFSENVSAYFTLIGKEYNREQLTMMSDLVALLKCSEEKQREWEKSLSELQDKLINSERKASKSQIQLEKANKKLAASTSKLKESKLIEKQYQKLLDEFDITTKEKKSAILQIHNLEKQVMLLKESVKKLQKEKDELEISIRAKIEKETEALLAEDSFPFAPADMDEFKEYFSYNLESIDVNDSALPVKSLLTAFVSNILFRGKPIICNKNYAKSLTGCISNTIAGNAPINTIAFSTECDKKSLYAAIKNSGRIVILDNFLGNYNETVLLTVLDRFKSKIIFLTVTYEKTLFYLPKEFLADSYYINLSYISGFMRELIPDEDPSVLDEKEIVQSKFPLKNRNQDIIQSIARELGYSISLSKKASEFVHDDLSACAELAFDLIPYVGEVLGINAFNISETLQRYTARCPYKNLFEEWFMS